ncbi:MAG: NADP oxidoreductase [Anaerolineae bacterium]|nr:NADP oxidoreductase [Anaerolineae bacterium]
MAAKTTIATIWLDGCSGCHMSFLDIDEALIDLASKIDLVYSPLVDHKEFPDMVDVTLVEGAVSNEDDLEKIKRIRKHTRILVSLGDCAVTGNVPSMRNVFPVEAITQRAYIENVTEKPGVPTEKIPPLLPKVRPVHQVVDVDVFIPGCPPNASLILNVLQQLLDGKKPDLSGQAHFG